MLIDRWLRFWFEPAAPTNLGLSRAVFFGGVFLMYVFEDFSAWASVSPAFWMPIPAFEALHLRPLAPGVLNGVEIVWRVSLMMAAVGLFTRTSMAAAFGLSFYLFGLPHNFGHTYHFDAALVLIMGVLACSKAGDAWSIDALRRSRRPVEPSGEYTWPIRAVWVTMSLVFFAAGLAKLRYGGLEWITSANMAIVLMRAPYHVSDADPITHAGLWIAGHPWLYHSLAAASVFIELAFVSVLFSRRARIVMVPAAFALLVGIRILMGPTFGGFLVANAFWVPWAAIGQRMARWTSAPGRQPVPEVASRLSRVS